MSHKHLLSLLLILYAVLPLPCGMSPAVLSVHADDAIHLHHINAKGYVVRAVYRDAHGILWLGTTSGLVSLPQLESRDPSSYHRRVGDANLSVKRISGDSQGRLWLKTHYNDNLSYDPRRSEFVDDTPAMLATKGIRVHQEFTATYDADDVLWVWMDNEFYWLPKDADKATKITFAAGERLRNVLFSGRGPIALSETALYRVSTDERRIVQTIPLPAGYNFRDHLFVAHDGTLWIWASDMLWCYVASSSPVAGGDQKTSSANTQHAAGGTWKPMLHTSSDITTIAEDADHRLWVGTQSDGLYISDLQGNLVSHLRHTPGTSDGLQSDRVEVVSYDAASQTMWIAYTKGGLSAYNAQRRALQLSGIASSGAVTDVLTFAPSQHDGVWIGLEERGVWLHDSQGDHQVIDGGSAVSLFSAHDGSLWTGIYHHGLIHRTADGAERLYLPGTSPFAVTEDDHGSIYAALLGTGVWYLDPATGIATDTHLKPKFVFDLEYSHHRLYAATTEGIYTKTPHQEWQLLAEGHYHTINIDQKGYIWAAGNEGSEGLALLDPQGRPVPLPDDLSTAPLKSLAIDREGNVWAATPSQLLLLRYRPGDKQPLERHSFKLRTDDQSLFYNPRASYVDDAGILWLGATTGYQRIDTRQLMAHPHEKEHTHPLVVGAVSINGNILSPGEMLDGRVVLTQDVVFTRELHLRAGENNLVIECSDSWPGSNVGEAFYYQLHGLSDTWHPFDGHTIVLPNLPYGHYTLYTRTESSEAALLLTIHIAPPLWLSWWAYCLYVLLCLVVAVIIMRYVKGRRAYRQQLRELQLQQEQQTQMNEMKLRFFTNISHDLRTPLSLIIGPVEEMLTEGTREEGRGRGDEGDEAISPNQRTLLTMVHRNAQHLLTLVNQILDFRRLEVGHERLLLSYGDIVTLIGDICESFRLKAEKDQVAFTFRPTVERVETMFDRDKVTKIMMNLLSNAFKFTPAGGSITITLDISEGRIIIAVADTGVGIADADKPHIFDRFYKINDDRSSSARFDLAKNRSTMGSGIGLHIVREYVRLHDGEISVSDNVASAQHDGRCGTVFQFSLPLKKKSTVPDTSQKGRDTLPAESDGAVPAAETVASAELPSKEEAGSGASSTILLVDDNADLLAYMRQSLAADYRILTASNGIEALVLLQQDVDILVSDVMMPDMDGLELCRRVKTDIETSHIPIVLLTAKTMASDELRGLEAGADDYITKPFSMDILRKRLHTLVERSRRSHERFAHEVDIEPSEITVTSLDEQFIARAIAIVEQHIAEPDYSIEQLSEELGVHRAHLYKKLMHLTGKSPQQFMRVLRLKRGKQLLDQSGLYVSEVAYKVGFNSPRIFSKYFKEEFGVTPKDYMK